VFSSETLKPEEVSFGQILADAQPFAEAIHLSR